MAFVLVLCFSLSCPALAAVDGDSSLPTDATGVESQEPLQVEVTLVPSDNGASEAVPYVAGEEVIIAAEAVETILTILGEINANTQEDPVSIIGADQAYTTQNLLVPSERTGLAATMADIFGTYTPLTYEVTTYAGGTTYTTTEIVPGLAGMDWPYLCGVSLFAIMLFCLYKLIGGVLS